MSEAASGSGLRVSLLGRFQVALGACVLIEGAWPRHKAQALVKLLALQPGRSLHREQVFEALWPDLTREAAGAQLRQNLHHLRTALKDGGVEAPLVTTQGNLVSLSEETSIDVEDFRRAAQATHSDNDIGVFEHALALYAAGLLQEDLYEEWTQRPREELAGLRSQLLLALGNLQIERGQLDAAAAPLEQLVAVDRANEEAHRALMRAYALSGNRDRALRQYQECRKALQRELEVAPSAETEALCLEIVAGRMGPNGAPALAATPSPAVAAGGGPSSRRWASGRVRLVGAALALGIIGGAVAGGLALGGAFDSGSSGGSALGFTTGRFHVVMEGLARLAGGDCVSTDLVYSVEMSGQMSGTLTGEVKSLGTTTFAVQGACALGVGEGNLTFSDRQGNKVFVKNAGFVTLTAPANASSSAELDVPKNPFIVVGGTGSHEGLVGRGLCLFANASEAISPDVVAVSGQGDCSVELRRASSPAEPVIAEAGASSLKLATMSSNSDAPKRILLIVMYLNDSDKTRTGLTLGLPEPFGARVAVASGDEELVPADERVWSLPDLPPGEVGRFYFSIQLLSASSPTIALQPEVRGASFDRPARTTPVTVEVVR